VDGEPLNADESERREGGKTGRREKAVPPQRTRIPSTSPRSQLVVTPRASGGVSIAQGPVFVLVGPDEIEPLVEAIKTTK
jgi:hypothetical protein